MATRLTRGCGEGLLPAERPSAAKGTNGQNAGGWPWTGTRGGGGVQEPPPPLNGDTALSFLSWQQQPQRRHTFVEDRSTRPPPTPPGPSRLLLLLFWASLGYFQLCVFLLLYFFVFSKAPPSPYSDGWASPRVADVSPGGRLKATDAMKVQPGRTSGAERHLLSEL